MRKRRINFQRLFLSRCTNKASILVLTLWVLCFLAVFGAYLSRGVRQKLALVKNLSFRSSLHYLADAGLKKAIMELMLDETDYDALKDNWSNNPTVFEKMPVGLGTVTVSYFTPGRDGIGKERFGIIDEERKLNINTAHRFIIQRLLETCVALDGKEAQEIAAAVVDWRDGDSMLSIPAGSAEDSYYRNLKEPYNCKDAAFQALEEVLLVKGMNTIIWEKIKDFITIYGSGQVNINTASQEVLLALGVEEITAEKLLEYRAGSDGEDGTSDDNIFESPSSIATQLAGFAALSSYELASLQNIVSAGFVTTTSFYFTVHSKASIGQMSKDITCVVEKNGRLVSWREL